MIARVTAPVRRTTARLPVGAIRPWHVLGGLVLVQWVCVLGLALSVRHNGWLYYQGGDQTSYFAPAWALGEWRVPASYVGYGWSYLMAPFTWISGPNYVLALPPIVLFQVLVLLPVALVSIYSIAETIAGRAYGYAAAALWVAVPYICIPLFDPRFHERYVEQLLPQALGLTGMADFPSLVAVLAASAFLLRALTHRSPTDAVLAGLVAGFAFGLKPANLAFLPAPLLALAAARRWRHLAVFAAAVVPSLATLALWKQRALGEQPAFTQPRARLAAGDRLALPDLGNVLEKYYRVDWENLWRNLDQVREFFWSVRILEWLVAAGIVAVARRSVPKAVFLAAWLLGFVILKGSPAAATVESGSFFRYVMPGFPPLVIFLAALPLLLPGRRPASSAARPAGRATLATVALVLALGPVAVISLARLQTQPLTLRHYAEGSMLPVNESFQLRSTQTAVGRRLTWDPPDSGSTHVSYTVYRVSRDVDTRCETKAGAATMCLFDTDQMGFTRRPVWDDDPPRGVWTYRIGLSANWQDEPKIGDAFMLSAPLTVRVG